MGGWARFAFVFAAFGCGGDDGGGASDADRCQRQCQILGDCGAVDDVSGCQGTCQHGLNGQCIAEEECVDYGGGNIRGCVEALLSHNDEANGLECTDEFVGNWCETYYTDPDCAPILLGGITCEGGGGGCTNDCISHDDGECDDGGPGSLYSICKLGTDCNDCGPR